MSNTEIMLRDKKYISDKKYLTSQRAVGKVKLIEG